MIDPHSSSRKMRLICYQPRCLEYKEGDAKRHYLPGLAKSFDCSKFNSKSKSETPFCSQSLHSCDIVIQRSGSYTTVISAWIVENTEKAWNLNFWTKYASLPLFLRKITHPNHARHESHIPAVLPPYAPFSILKFPASIRIFDYPGRNHSSIRLWHLNGDTKQMEPRTVKCPS